MQLQVLKHETKDVSQGLAILWQEKMLAQKKVISFSDGSSVSGLKKFSVICNRSAHYETASLVEGDGR